MKIFKRISPFLFLVLFLGSCNNSDPEAFAYGNFESEDVFISAETTGRILYLGIDEGDSIEKGDTIALIDTTQLNLKYLQLLAAKKAVASKLSQINRQKDVNQVGISNLDREIKRFGSLFLEEAATKKQMDDLEGQLKMLEAQEQTLNSQKQSVYAEVESIEVQVLQIRDMIERSIIRAPFNSNVLEIYTREGELAAAGRKLIKIADLSYLNLRIFIQGDQLSSIRLGNSINVVYDGAEGLNTTKGEVIWISDEAEFTPKIIQTRDDRISLVYAAKIKVLNDGSLKIGMPGEINLED